jgi:hypothetical protein
MLSPWNACANLLLILISQLVRCPQLGTVRVQCQTQSKPMGFNGGTANFRFSKEWFKELFATRLNTHESPPASPYFTRAGLLLPPPENHTPLEGAGDLECGHCLSVRSPLKCAVRRQQHKIAHNRRSLLACRPHLTLSTSAWGLGLQVARPNSTIGVHARL